jgi:hypothetical protein
VNALGRLDTRGSRNRIEVWWHFGHEVVVSRNLGWRSSLEVSRNCKEEHAVESGACDSKVR